MTADIALKEIYWHIRPGCGTQNAQNRPTNIGGGIKQSTIYIKKIGPKGRNREHALRPGSILG